MSLTTPANPLFPLFSHPDNPIAVSSTDKAKFLDSFPFILLWTIPTFLFLQLYLSPGDLPYTLLLVGPTRGPLFTEELTTHTARMVSVTAS